MASKPLYPKYAFANVPAGGAADVLVAAISGKKIRLLAATWVVGATASSITFQTKPTDSAATAISCLFANAANGGAVLPYNPAGWFVTGSGEGLVVTNTAGSAVGIQVVYDVVP